MLTQSRDDTRHGFLTIGYAGALAGALDLIFAVTLWGLQGVPPEMIARSVASGLLGAEAFTAGTGVIFLGVFLHFAIATAMAIAFYLAPATWRDRPFIAGPVYGALLWLAMNLIVVPFSAAPLRPPPTLVQIADAAAHMLLVGLPIALLCRPAKREMAPSNLQ